MPDGGVASGQVFPRLGAAFGLQDKPENKRERENINTACLGVAQLQTDQHKKHIGTLNNFDKRHLKKWSSCSAPWKGL